MRSLTSVVVVCKVTQLFSHPDMPILTLILLTVLGRTERGKIALTSVCTDHRPGQDGCNSRQIETAGAGWW